MNTKSLDGFRFILALWVCLGHFYIIIGGANFFHIPILSQLLTTPVNAVDGFIMITGFLMTYHYFLREEKEPFHHKSTWYTFVVRRMFRLYPVYLIAIIASFFLVSEMYAIRKEMLEFFTGSSLTIWGNESKLEEPTLLGLVSHLFFVHGLIPGEDSTILSVAWSLSLEMQFYVLFPLIFLYLFNMKKQSRMFGVTIITVVLSILSMKLYYYFFDMPAFLLAKFPLFLLGMLMAAAGLGKIKWSYFFVCSMIILSLGGDLLTAVIAMMIFVFLFLDNIKSYMHPILYQLLDFVRSLLSSKASKLGADISYSLYLFHMITIPFIVKYFINMNLDRYQVAVFSLLTMLIINFSISYISYLFVEKPFIQLGKKAVKARQYSYQTVNQNLQK